VAERAAARAWREDVERRTAVREPRPARTEPGARPDGRPQLSLVVTRTEDRPRRTDEAAPRRDPATGRRTVAITGQRAAPAPRRRPDAASRVGPRPDRVAMWAFVMGMFLVFVATATADAAPL
jgi:hypothetical protein